MQRSLSAGEHRRPHRKAILQKLRAEDRVDTWASIVPTFRGFSYPGFALERNRTLHSWSNCPVVFFAAPAWRVEILAGLIASERCGLDADRNMLTIYAASVSDLHNLAQRILAERGRFRRRPDHLHPSAAGRATSVR